MVRNAMGLEEMSVTRMTTTSQQFDDEWSIELVLVAAGSTSYMQMTQYVPRVRELLECANPERGEVHRRTDANQSPPLSS